MRRPSLAPVLKRRTTAFPGAREYPIAIATGDPPANGADRKKLKCKRCEGKGLVKQGNKKVKCQRCGGTGYRP